MKVRKIIGICAAAFGAWLFVLRGAGALVFSLRSWAIDHFDFNINRTYIQMNFSVRNPLMVGFTVTGISGDVYVNGLRAGRVENRGKIYLARNSETVIPVVAEINNTQLTDAVLYGLQNDIVNTKISFDGNVYVGDMNVAIPVQIDYKA